MSAVAAGLDLGQLASESERLLEFLYVCPVGLVETDEAGEVSLMNPLAARLLMPIAAPASLANLFAALEPYAPDLRYIASSFGGERGAICENRRIHLRQGRPDAPEVLACSLIKIERGRIMAVLTDVTEQVVQERRLKEAESWFSMILAGVNDFALLSLDATGRISAWNVSGERQTGYASRDVLGRTMNVFYFPDEAVQGRALQQVDLARRDGWHIDEGWRRRKDGSRYWCQSLVSALEEKTGEVTGFSVVLRDVTQSKTNAEEIRRLLTTDQLTGVSNRARFFELGEAEFTRWKRFRQPLSAMMVDVDHFKRVNDGHGHAAGDEVLKQVAASLQGGLRSIDAIGRLGGEEFAILLPSVDLQGAAMIAERLRQTVAALAPVVDGRTIPVTVSIGCAEIAADAPDLETLLKSADGALYAAKQGGRNKVAVVPPAAAA
ncbi:sensor domain-containing diguanylate cyclase [Enterovirga aerilata]|uniref:GGDEF domain-containing protein n=1 Tax=Enterovirga aerilata TaxID=2730920 RepID=A0A849I799_9HYPH|nr:sensor domain-containing diguanylate cyclase [Enterovirga sp. DB1703]NNM73161.1 GGDEF domain-containing protein [Enterovirga sp. DB1703]